MDEKVQALLTALVPQLMLNTVTGERKESRGKGREGKGMRKTIKAVTLVML
jgi:hypothetical protein